MKWPWLLLTGAAAPLLAQTADLPTSTSNASDLPPAELAVRALDAQPSVEAANARIASARASSDALSRGPHEITAQGTLSRRDVDGERRYTEYDATISRPFRLPGKAALDRHAGALGVGIAVDRAEDVRHQAALTLGMLWYDWLLAAELHHNARTLVENQWALARATERRVRARDAAQLDLEQAHAALALAEAQVQDAVAARERARALLQARFPELLLPADPPSIRAPTLSDADLSALAEQVVTHSHEIAAADGQAQRQSTLARRAHADRIADPSLGLRLFSERGGAERGAGVAFSLPFGGGHRSALARQADADASAAQSDKVAIAREVGGQAAADVAEFRARESAWRASRDAVIRVEQAAGLARRGQQMGVIDLADVLYAERQVTKRAQELASRAAAARLMLKLRIDSHSLWLD